MITLLKRCFSLAVLAAVFLPLALHAQDACDSSPEALALRIINNDVERGSSPSRYEVRECSYFDNYARVCFNYVYTYGGQEERRNSMRSYFDLYFQSDSQSNWRVLKKKDHFRAQEAALNYFAPEPDLTPSQIIQNAYAAYRANDDFTFMTFFDSATRTDFANKNCRSNPVTLDFLQMYSDEISCTETITDTLAQVFVSSDRFVSWQDKSTHARYLVREEQTWRISPSALFQWPHELPNLNDLDAAAFTELYANAVLRMDGPLIAACLDTCYHTQEYIQKFSLNVTGENTNLSNVFEMKSDAVYPWNTTHCVVAVYPKKRVEESESQILPPILSIIRRPEFNNEGIVSLRKANNRYYVTFENFKISIQYADNLYPNHDVIAPEKNIRTALQAMEEGKYIKALSVFYNDDLLNYTDACLDMLNYRNPETFIIEQYDTQIAVQFFAQKADYPNKQELINTAFTKDVTGAFRWSPAHVIFAPFEPLPEDIADYSAQQMFELIRRYCSERRIENLLAVCCAGGSACAPELLRGHEPLRLRFFYNLQKRFAALQDADEIVFSEENIESAAGSEVRQLTIKVTRKIDRHFQGNTYSSVRTENLYFYFVRSGNMWKIRIHDWQNAR